MFHEQPQYNSCSYTCNLISQYCNIDPGVDMHGLLIGIQAAIASNIIPMHPSMSLHAHRSIYSQLGSCIPQLLGKYVLWMHYYA